MVNISPPPPNLTGRRYFSPEQLAQVSAVFEAIWPGGAEVPGAKDAGAADYIDMLLGCDDLVYYEIANWRPLYVAGLAMLNAAAQGRPGATKALGSMTVEEMSPLLADLTGGKLNGFPDAAWQKRFFNTLRSHCIEGCLADPRWGGNQNGIIWKWLGYPNGQARNFKRKNPQTPI